MHEVLSTPGRGLNELSASTGLHENTLRDHLRVLEDEGFVVSRTVHTQRRGRPRKVYDPSAPEHPNPVAAQRVEQAKRRGDLYRRMLPRREGPSRLGTEATYQIDAMYEHLDDAGLEPDVDENELQVDLVPCAFHDLVDHEREVICHVHGELIRGVLRQAGGPVEMEVLEPLKTPHSCVVQLMLREESDAADGD